MKRSFNCTLHYLGATALRSIFSLLISFFLFIIFLELGLFGLSKCMELPFSEPSYFTPSKSFYADINKDFGIWHYPNSSFRHKVSCFDVEYHANSYGACDIEREKVSDNFRIIVLGDSFVEGYGVNQEQRFTNQLESKTDIEHLNFGTSGHFGTTQEALLYSSLASNFSHDYVFIAFLPDNDFFDDDLAFGKRAHPNRYRPYYTGEYPNYNLIYFNSANLGKAMAHHSQLIEKMKSSLTRYTYTYNVAIYLKKLWIYRTEFNRNNQTYSGYYDYTEAEFLRTRYSLEKIVRQAQNMNKEVCLFTIPVENDFLRYEEKGEAPLSKQMKELATELGFEYLDLLPEMNVYHSKGEHLFLPCDGHWNALGHQVASSILLEKLSVYNQIQCSNY